MRGLLFLLIGIVLACVVGFTMFDAPTIATEVPVDPAEPAATSPPLALFALLVLGSWSTLLVRGPFWLRLVLCALVVAIGSLTLLAGAFSAYWDHYMRPSETAGWWWICTGVLMLLSQVVAWLRSNRDWYDEWL